LAIEETWQQQQTNFEDQINELNAQILAAQQELDDLKSQEQELFNRVQKLETTYAEQKTAHQTDLQQVRSEYTSRQTQLQTKLDEVRAELGNVNAKLGH
jgi:chromosome segregation ATPase